MNIQIGLKPQSKEQFNFPVVTIEAISTEKRTTKKLQLNKKAAELLDMNKNEAGFITLAILSENEYLDSPDKTMAWKVSSEQEKENNPGAVYKIHKNHSISNGEIFDWLVKRYKLEGDGPHYFKLVTKVEESVNWYEFVPFTDTVDTKTDSLAAENPKVTEEGFLNNTGDSILDEEEETFTLTDDTEIKGEEA